MVITLAALLTSITEVDLEEFGQWTVLVTHTSASGRKRLLKDWTAVL